MMRVENINMFNDTMAIMDRGYYEVNGKRINLKLSKREMEEISVFLPKDIKRIADNKDFEHIYVIGRIGVGCVNMDSYSLAIKRYTDCSYMFSKKSKPILVLNLANPVNPGGGVRHGSKAQEEDLCRKSSLLLSLESSKASAYYKYNKSFPSISTGVYRFPKEKAAGIAVKTVNQFVEANPGKIDLVEWILFDEDTLNIYENALSQLQVSKNKM